MAERLRGAAAGRRRKWALVVAPLAAISLMLVFALGASANSLASSKFEIDDPGGTVGANLVENTNCTVSGTGGTNCIDWVSIPNTGTPNETRQADLPTGSGDDSYKGGSKEDDPCPKIEDGSIPNNKSDLRVFGSYKEPVAGGPGILHVFWSRVQDPSGTTNMDFEFNKSTVKCGGADTVNMVRTAGDILLQFDVDNGGAVAKLSKRTWLGSAWSQPTALGTTVAIGSINQQTIASGSADGLGALSARTFGEASFDLASVFDPAKCESFGSAMLKSRSSDSFTSALKDFIRPIPLNIQNCASVIIRKVTQPAGDSQSFGYHETFNTDPAQAAPGNVFSLTGAAANDDITFSNVIFGTGLTVTEDAPPANWVFVSLDCSASTGIPAAERVIDSANRKVTFTLNAASDILDCTYTNRKQLGAIKVTKTRKHAESGTGSHPHAGVNFTVNGVTKATGTDGTACFDGLPFATYAVLETLPVGYSADQALSQNVTVDNTATCADTTYGGETVSFGNTPLTDVSVVVDSLVAGGTKTDVDCDNGVDAATGAGGDGTIVVANDEEPGTIICTIVIDP
jgi:hypothetical protein